MNIEEWNKVVAIINLSTSGLSILSTVFIIIIWCLYFKTLNNSKAHLVLGIICADLILASLMCFDYV